MADQDFVKQNYPFLYHIPLFLRESVLTCKIFLTHEIYLIFSKF